MIKKNEYIPYNKLLNKENIGVSGKPIGLLSTTQEYEENNLVCEENSADEIENAIKELDMFLEKSIYLIQIINNNLKIFIILT